MENNVKKCPFCGSILDEKSILYKGYYVCSSCANIVDDSQNADKIRRYSNYIRNLEFGRAETMRNLMLDNTSMDANELQLFTFYSSILNLFTTSEPSKVIKFLNDTTVTDMGVVIEVLNFLASISSYIQKLGSYILKYVNMHEKYLANVSNHELEITFIEVKKRFFKAIANKSGFIQSAYKLKQMNLREIIDLISEEDPDNIAALYSIFDDVEATGYSPEEINYYLTTCDYALELYYKKNHKQITDNYRIYYRKASVLRKKYSLKIHNRYKWQRRINNYFFKDIVYLVIIITIFLVIFNLNQ